MRQYVGLIHKDTGSHFGVSFPDFPGVVTAGATVDEAHELAEEALAFHVKGMIEDGKAVPLPTQLDEIRADTENPVWSAIWVPLTIN